MTVSSAATAPPVQAKTGEGAGTAPEQATGFDKLLMAGDPAELPMAQIAPPGPQAETPAASLEALLQSLTTAFLPDAASVLPTKSGKRSLETGAKADAPAKSDPDDVEGAEFALLAVPQLTLPPVLSKFASAPEAEAEGVTAKSGSHTSPMTDLMAVVTSAVATAFPADLLKVDGTAALAATAPADLAATSVDRMVDTARDVAWLDRLSRDIAESAGSGDRVRFRLLPPTLGALDVTVERQAAGLSVNLTTHSTEARNLFVETRQQMVDGLKAQGVPLVQLYLTAAGEDHAGHRPPTFFSPLIEVAASDGTDLAAQPDDTLAGRTGRFA